MSTATPSPLYDSIGRGYAVHRRPDPRIARRIAEALGDARSVVNVGAGAGSYEPADRAVVAVEPSGEMVRQRETDAAPAVRARAEQLPFRDRAFDAAMAILTIHHWTDAARGLAEMRRVARKRIVLLTWDPGHAGWWLVRDYFPEIPEMDRAIFPSLDVMRAALGPFEVHAIPVPADCVDGFLGAYWRRPEAYLDDSVRGAISAFPRLAEVDARIARLRADLTDGTWRARNGDLLARDELDLGYRLIVA